jgi:FAD/FMN-containing dehydrogenase
MPAEELVVRFQMSRRPPVAYPEIDALLRMNRLLYERARDVGGTRLTISAIPMSRSDWVQHYGPVWPWFQRVKKRFDPANVLTPGPGF